MKSLDDTCTDSEFRKNINQADTEWMSGHARPDPDPDLEAEGLSGSPLSRIMGLLSGRKG